MPKVKDLKKLHKEAYLVRFELEDDSVQEYTVSTDLVVEYRLLVGKEFDKVKFKAFVNDQRIDSIFQVALKYCLKYHKSEYETLEYLRKKEVEEETIPQVILKLKRLKAIDDESLVQSLLDNLFHRQLNGPSKIEFALKQKGFEEQLIHYHLSSIKYADIENNLEKLFSKRLSLYKNKSIASATRMMTSYLVQKGYELNRVQAFIMSHKSDFSETIDEDLTIVAEYEKVNRKYAKTMDNTYELNQKIITSLLSKGYSYTAIKKILERR